ncbi:MAG: hypothetical protein E7437_04645 [Ruminococcaceae bacterium]|nr:hypothetical protein [Oscillospiraceae bacterium]
MTEYYSYGDLTPGSVTGGFALRLEITEVSVDPQANASVLEYRLFLRSGTQSAFSGKIDCHVRVDGKEYSETADVVLGNSGSVTLLTGQVTVTHNAEGGKSFPVQGWTDEAADGPPFMRVSGILKLSPIGEVCTLGATDAYIGGTAIIAVTRNHASYCYTLGYTFGGCQGYLDSQGRHSDTPVYLQAQTVIFPIPEVFYEQIPDKTEDKCTLSCTTYMGSAPVGLPSVAQFRVLADPAVCAPVLTGSVSDANTQTAVLTGDPQVLVRYLSSACCRPVVIPQKGATIQSLTVNGLPVENGQVVIEGVESPLFHIAAKDSRGFTAELLMEAPWVSYVSVSAKVEAKRTDPVSGKVRIFVTGLCYGGSFGACHNTLEATVTTLTGETVALQTTVTDNTYTAAGELTGLDYTRSHTLTVKVSDQVETVTKQVTVGKGVPVFDWGERDFQFHVPITVPGINGADQDLCLGLCQDADACLRTGTYALTELSRNVPVTAGGLVVFSWGMGALQLVVDASATGCYLRTLAESASPWRLLKWEDLTL